MKKLRVALLLANFLIAPAIAQVPNSGGIGVPNSGGLTCSVGQTVNGPLCTATPTLGASGTLGSVTLGNATSGLLTLEPTTGALGNNTIYLPVPTSSPDTVALLGTAQTFTATKTFNNATYSALFTGGNVGIGTATPGALFTVGNNAFEVNASGNIVGGSLTLGAGGTLGSVTLGNATSGLLTLEPTTGALGNNTIYLPVPTSSPDTVALLGTAQTFTATKTFNNATYSALFTGGNVGIGTATPGALFTVGNNAFEVNASGNIVGGSLTLGAGGTLGSVTLGNATSGLLTLEPTTGALGNNTIYLPVPTSSPDTVALLGTAQTFTATKTFNNATYSALFTGGNVGIGTATPVNNLNIAFYNASTNLPSSAGGITIQNTDNSSGVGSGISFAINDGTVVAGVYGEKVANDTGALLFAVSGSEAMRIAGGGNVGIGTATPGALFTVGNNAFEVNASGNIVGGSLTLGAGGTLGSVTLGNATSGLLTLEPTTGALGNNTIYLPVPTSSPDTVALLGTAQTFTATKTFNNATYSALFTGGNVGIGTATPGALFTVGNNAFEVNASGNIVGGSLTLGAGGTLGSVTLGNATSGLLTLEPTTGALGNNTIYLPVPTSSPDTVALLGTAQTFTATKTFNNATYSALFTGGNVGIGTATPGALFTVGNNAFEVNASGNIVGGSLTLGAGGTLGSVTLGNATSGLLTLEPTTGALGNNTIYLPVPTSSPDTVALLGTAQTFTATKTFNNATYSALFTGGNVGIGTATPVNNLNIAFYNASTNLPSSAGGITIQNTDNSSGVGSGISFAINDGTVVAGVYGEKVVNDTGALLFAVSGSEAMRIAGGGNVGIGTATPGALFTVGNNAFEVNSSGNIVGPITQFGVASATPAPQTLQFGSGSGTNIAGANATIIGSLSTGTGTDGDMIFQTGVKNGSSGSTAATATTAVTIKGETQQVQFAAAPQFGSSTTGAGTETFTNSPCTGLTTERWIPVAISGQTGTWYVPACQ